jgi:hypothetical protein
MHVLRQRMAALRPQDRPKARPWRVDPPDEPGESKPAPCTEDVIATLVSGLKTGPLRLLA